MPIPKESLHHLACCFRCRPHCCCCCSCCFSCCAALQAEDTASETQTPRSLAIGTDGGGAGSSIVPLLDKKAGIRDAGLIFAPGKSWVMGLLLVIVSGLVLAVTLLTALLD
jgi:hypothetical protein